MSHAIILTEIKHYKGLNFAQLCPVKLPFSIAQNVSFSFHPRRIHSESYCVYHISGLLTAHFGP